ncbi:hypothetical protein BN946_scf184905.g10 [Trametes cinnabarina]|uniref:Uncharacterized protein n=1 Tax=Pycnoporus cinnabarinus TaxID=5643 RepID=A0A060SCT5_PYCCI|nr:hypothetical protein BN946_scf184905.g10 [Trametes cinnabarina]
MPKRSRRAQIAIANLGACARKKPRLDVNASEKGETGHDKENSVPAEKAYLQVIQASARARDTFSTIAQPVWSGSSSADTPASPALPPEKPMASPGVMSDGPAREQPGLSLQSALLESTQSESTHRPPSTGSTHFEPPPSIADAQAALKDITAVLRPRRPNGKGYLRFKSTDDQLCHRMEQMKMFLSFFARAGPGREGWLSASLWTADAFQKGPACARSLRSWTRAFIVDRHVLPHTAVRPWQQTLLEKDPELKAAVEEHLQSVGKYVCAMDIVQFTSEPINILRFNLAKPISLSTAQSWMHRLEYRWTKAPSDYGWLHSPDGAESARVLFKAGKNCDGYFTHDDILAHAKAAMDILDKHYPDKDHIFVFDNAPTHLKHAADALSARHMSKFPTQPDKPMFGVAANVYGLEGKPVYGQDGKLLKTKVRMGDARFRSGDPQPLYFPEGHARANIFKGMAIILKEHGFKNTHAMHAQCPDFKCKPPALNCCCRRLLFNEPDFRDVETLLETQCRLHGFKVIYLPKFHSPILLVTTAGPVAFDSL